MADYDVMKRPDGDWEAKREGASRASSTYGTQQEAVKGAQQHSHNSGGGEVRIHRGDNNRIRESYTVPPAKDPYPPKG